MSARVWDYAIVGSGAGGATVARELARRNKHVLVIEAGKRADKVGAFRDALGYYDLPNRMIPFLPMPRKTKGGGVIIWRAMMAGGSTVVSCGNAVRCLEEEFRDHGIDLTDDFANVEHEMGVSPVAERLLSSGSRALAHAAQDLGYEMKPMPKFIDGKACRKCGLCVFGCPNRAKWTALNFLDEAEDNGAETLYGTKVKRILIENHRARGVEAVSKEGNRDIRAGAVVLAAGGLATPLILQNSGVAEAGSGLFADLLVNVYGTTRDDKLNQVFEPSMALVDLEFHETEGFLLSPYVDPARMIRFVEGGVRGFALDHSHTLGIMVKTVDEPAGRVNPDGSVYKPITDRDWERLKRGASVAKEILSKAGAKSLMVSTVEGGHPGGTAAIGNVVDHNLQTKVDGLYVCDASVLPAPPGLPPILTIVALAQHLGKRLA